jgi:signal transduction histidine kinase
MRLDDDARVLDEDTRSRNEQSLLQAQKLRNLALMTGSVAHDFNNLIGSILGNISFAMREMPPGSPSYEASIDIETAARRAAELTRRLGALSSQGRSTIESLDFNRIVEEMANQMREAIPTSASLRLDLGADLPLINADAAQVQQVIMNLLTNAFQSLPAGGGVVTLTTGRTEVDGAHVSRSDLHFNRNIEAGTYVHFEVVDTGRGMSSDILGRIVDPSSAAKGANLGLGLSATLAIVRAMRGAVGAGSKPGGGTTVTIVLPVGGRGRSSGAPRISSSG